MALLNIETGFGIPIIAERELFLLAFLAIPVLMMIGMFLIILRAWRSCKGGQAIVRNGMGGPMVSFSGMVCVPFIHKYEYVDLSLRRLTVEHTLDNPLVFKDQKTASCKSDFEVRIPKDREKVVEALNLLGDRINSDDQLVEHFAPKFSEAIEFASRQLTLAEFLESLEAFRKEVLANLGSDFRGFELVDFAIHGGVEL